MSDALKQGCVSWEVEQLVGLMRVIDSRHLELSLQGVAQSGMDVTASNAPGACFVDAPISCRPVLA